MLARLVLVLCVAVGIAWGQCTVGNASSLSCSGRFASSTGGDGGDCTGLFESSLPTNITTLCLNGGGDSLSMVSNLLSLVNLFMQDGGPPSGTLEQSFFGYSVEMDWFSWMYANISSFTPGCFQNLQNLEDLQLTHGLSLTSIAANSFAGLNQLNSLTVSFTFTLTSIADGAFNGLTALSILDLRSNGISNISLFAFSQLTALSELILQNNRLSQLSPGVFDTLQNLFNLDLSINNLNYVPPSVFYGAFFNDNDIPVSSWSYYNNSVPAPAFPQLQLYMNPLTRFIRGAPSVFSSNVQIVLSNAGILNKLRLSSCCGLEYLANRVARFFYIPGNILCNYNGTYIRVELLAGRIICPCASKVIANMTNGTLALRPNTWNECLAISQWKLVDNVCVNRPQCPAGQSLQLQYGQSVGTAAGTCAAEGKAMYIYDTICDSCAVPDCQSCPGSRMYCSVCNPGFYRYNGYCVASCPPPSYISNDQCMPCGLSTCAQCLDNLHCLQCVSNAYELNNGACTPCADPLCTNCTTNYMSCLLCQPGYAVSPLGMCMPCPDATCMRSTASSNSSTRVGIIVGIVVGTILIAVLLVYARIRWKRAAYVRKYGLRTSLLTGPGAVMDRAWQISPNEIVRFEVLRPGLFGDSVRGDYGQRPVSVSLITTASSQALDDFVDRSFAKVSSDYRAVHHPNLVAYYGAGVFSSGDLFLVYELLVSAPTLAAHVTAMQLDEDAVRQISRDIATGMAFLHQRDLTHGSLSAHTVVISAPRTARISEAATVAIARTVHPTATAAHDTAALPRAPLTAPEVGPGSITKPADVFAYGFVLWHVLARQDPLEFLPQDETGRAREAALRANQRPTILDTFPPSLSELMSACWASDSSRRPSFETVAQKLNATTA
eukprot:m.81600 g.81600  ORF g.81600 m.81600 type:complete len:890 (+) comp13370_c5_seq4:1439-4108(+)